MLKYVLGISEKCDLLLMLKKNVLYVSFLVVRLCLIVGEVKSVSKIVAPCQREDVVKKYETL